ncbi:MAG: sigma-70 family RNA polymerase sigma factor [Bacteroidaceae bacterium]|nr:sigma-70 family RNA polymerase sigma factor [Bacteroidaceae bacterium]
MKWFGTQGRHLSDEDLMYRCQQGSDKAFEELYHRFARRLQGFFFRQLGGQADVAADFTQDVFLRAYAARHSYREGCNVATWLFTIAYNLCRNAYRHHQAEADYVAQVEAEVEGSTPPVDLEMEQEELDELLERVLNELPSEMRLLFSLRYEEELTIPQMAQATGLPEGTIKSRISRTMNIIKQKITQYETYRS